MGRRCLQKPDHCGAGDQPGEMQARRIEIQLCQHPCLPRRPLGRRTIGDAVLAYDNDMDIGASPLHFRGGAHEFGKPPRRFHSAGDIGHDPRIIRNAQRGEETRITRARAVQDRIDAIGQDRDMRLDFGGKPVGLKLRRANRCIRGAEVEPEGRVAYPRLRALLQRVAGRIIRGAVDMRMGIVPFGILNIFAVGPDILGECPRPPARMRHDDVGTVAFALERNGGADKTLAGDNSAFCSPDVMMRGPGYFAMILVVGRSAGHPTSPPPAGWQR